MKRTLSPLSLLLVVLAVAVAFAPAPAAAQDLSRYVSIGDSLTHGAMNACVVKYGQTDSYPALIARSAGVDFQQPLVDDPGLGSPGCWVLQSLAPSITFKYMPSTGKLLNLALLRPYNNLGISSYKASDVVDKKGDTPPGITDTVLRGLGTALQQGASLKPTFVTVWIGNNDFLGAVTSAIVADGLTLTPRASFRASYDTILKTLAASQPNGVGSGVVIYADNAAKLRTRVAEFNADIRSLAATYGYKVLDLNAFFADLAAHGRDYGGMQLTKEIMTDGIFGYDGIHPTSVGYALIADEFVQLFNSTFTHPLPRPDIAAILLNDNSIGGWFPLPQGVTRSFEELNQITSQIYDEEGRAGLAQMFPLVGSLSELQPGDDGAPVTGSHGLRSHGRGSTETTH